MRHYTLKAFLRSAPNDMLEHYFKNAGLLADFDFGTLTPRKIDPLFERIQSLRATERRKVDADFQDIFALTYEGGVKLLLNEARHNRLSLIEDFEPLKGACAKAFWAFLYYRSIFDMALRLSCRDNLKGYWKSRLGLDAFDTKDFEKNSTQLKAELGKYFRNVIGGGRGCTVDYIARDSMHYFFAYPEGFSRSVLHYDNGKLGRLYYSAVLEVIFAYDALAGRLEIYHEGEAKAVEIFQKIFGETILQLKTLPPDKKPTYNLMALKDRNFKFNYVSESGITEVILTRLSLTYTGVDSETQEIAMKAYGSSSSLTLYQMMDTHFPMQSTDKRPSRDRAFAKTASLRVKFLPHPGRKRPGSVSFYITYPDSTNLKHDERGMIIRKMLQDSGIMINEKHGKQSAIEHAAEEPA